MFNNPFGFHESVVGNDLLAFGFLASDQFTTGVELVAAEIIIMRKIFNCRGIENLIGRESCIHLTGNLRIGTHGDDLLETKANDLRFPFILFPTMMTEMQIAIAFLAGGKIPGIFQLF